MKYTIRKARLNDINEILRLYKELCSCMIRLQQEYTKIPKEKFNHYNEDNKSYFCDALVSASNVVFVAEIESKVVGFIQSCIHEKDFYFDLDKYCYIPYYYVEEAYHNYSLCIDLYREIEKWSREKKIRYICSDVDGGNDISLKLQKKFCGMKPYKIRLMKQL